MSQGRGKANPQSPLLGKSKIPTKPSPGTMHQMKEERQKPSHHHHQNRCYTIFVDLINMLMSSAEIALVLYLTEHHFRESMGVIAVAMLAPILLNFVGVTYFFSDNRERLEFEKAGTSRLTRDMLQVPVLGPVFTAIQVLLISAGISTRPDVEYERFEASAVKMRQAQTFFSASPEAMVQLAVLLNTSARTIDTTHILEITVVVVSIFTLAEANVYALRSNYFRLFHTYEEGEWEVHESFGRKCILFFHSFCSIGARIAAAACLIASAQCFFRRRTAAHMMQMNSAGSGGTTTTRSPMMSHSSGPPSEPAEPSDAESTEQLGFIIGVTFVALILYHMLIYYIARLLRYSIMKQDIPGGCYESVNYGWRSTILHTGFQSRNIATQIWFYLENCVMFTIWWFSVKMYGNKQVKENTQLRMTFIFTAFSVLSLFFLFAAVGSGMHRLESPFKDRKRKPQPSVS